FIEILLVLLPLILVGAIAVFIVTRLKGKFKRDALGKKKTKDAQNLLDSFIPLGLFFGGAVGLIIALIFPIPLLPTLSLGAGFGALAGYFAYEHYSEKEENDS